MKRSRRVYQSDGVFIFKFNEFVDQENTTTYINIDGEFYEVNNIKEIAIEKADFYSHAGQITILKNDKNDIFD